MTIDPDALLIFRARGAEPKKKKPLAKEEELPKEGTLKSLGKFKPEPDNEPKIIPTKLEIKPKPRPQQIQQKQQEEQKIQPIPQPKEIPIQKEQMAPSKEEVQAVKKEIPQKFKTKESDTSNINLLGFKIFRKKPATSNEPEYEKSIYQEQAPQQKRETGELPISVLADNRYILKRGTSQQKTQLSREVAKGHICIWHPWRSAYAICDYCHRPFCFEDILEFDKDYYCLEDIDEVSATYKEKLVSSGNAIGTASGVLLMFAFLAFFYFSSAQIIYIFQYINRAGLPFFLANVNYSYSFALIESLLMILALFVAVLIFTQSRRGFYIAELMCLAAVTIFSYQYTNTGTLYFLIVDALVFVAFVGLLYSRAELTAGTPEERLLEPVSGIHSSMMKYPNVGKF